MHDSLLALLANLAAVQALDGDQQSVELPLDNLGPLESPPLASDLHPAFPLPLSDEEVESLHRVLLGSSSRRLTRSRRHARREDEHRDQGKTSEHDQQAPRRQQQLRR